VVQKDLVGEHVFPGDVAGLLDAARGQEVAKIPGFQAVRADRGFRVVENPQMLTKLATPALSVHFRNVSQPCKQILTEQMIMIFFFLVVVFIVLFTQHKSRILGNAALVAVFEP
jgi:hypothetical protein